MGIWKRCPKCSGKVDILVVIRKKITDQEREAWRCRACGNLEIVIKNQFSPVKVGTKR